ncbi:hypothetical protein BU14_2489s0001 [Porphyra umbilicalis]|uniref:Uncharacterized protein n=1 Tax=Porphyra umbilicalis TaxID=2786 RepID=A0A1X6NJ23_PORUM|nr:hypothetical protein BU14_2489s0001 [Porphyra umbilicalis]|eukprot:OSX68617.1 hypothetical protein BU14_2489s0001 [Porphyra umbilicalis]
MASPATWTAPPAAAKAAHHPNRHAARPSGAQNMPLAGPSQASPSPQNAQVLKQLRSRPHPPPPRPPSTRPSQHNRRGQCKVISATTGTTAEVRCSGRVQG